MLINKQTIIEELKKFGSVEEVSEQIPENIKETIIYKFEVLESRNKVNAFYDFDVLYYKVGFFTFSTINKYLKFTTEKEKNIFKNSFDKKIFSLRLNESEELIISGNANCIIELKELILSYQKSIKNYVEKAEIFKDKERPTYHMEVLQNYDKLTEAYSTNCNELDSISNLIFQYTMLNRKVYRILEQGSLRKKEEKNLISNMFLISDGIHNLAKFNYLSKKEILFEVSILNKVLKNINLDKQNHEIHSYLLEMKNEVEKIIKMQNQ